MLKIVGMGILVFVVGAFAVDRLGWSSAPYKRHVIAATGWSDRVDFRNVVRDGSAYCGQHSIRNTYGEVINWLDFIAVEPSGNAGWRVYLQRDFPRGLPKRCG